MLGTLLIQKCWFWGFPGGPVVKTPCYYCSGRGFNPWSGDEDPACCAAQPKKKKLLVLK